MLEAPAKSKWLISGSCPWEQSSSAACWAMRDLALSVSRVETSSSPGQVVTGSATPVESLAAGLLSDQEPGLVPGSWDFSLLSVFFNANPCRSPVHP